MGRAAGELQSGKSKLSPSYILSAVLCLTHRRPTRLVLVVPFYRDKKGSERLIHLPWVAQLLSYGAKGLAPNHCFSTAQ